MATGLATSHKPNTCMYKITSGSSFCYFLIVSYKRKKKKTYFLLITGNLREKTFHLAHLGDTDDVMMSQFLYPSQKHCFPMSGRMTSGSYQFSNPRGSSVLHSFPPQLNAVEEHTFEDPSHPPTVLRLLYLYKNLSICGFW